ncbi:NUDIX domain-containing protein [Paenibacillus humicola]|uniref:NUDIX domain-containing protein n=1 Tax=Paenibacillus humicola TaxID=3110540 RepID=UPI00237A4FEB|nr:NUDIX domain-containing protein [Paenibacillus humicola]
MEHRLMATAFLFNGERVLMMRKRGSRLYDAEFWSGLGGHLEPCELGCPMEACLREIEEESGIRAGEMTGLRLRYILLRLKEDEIRQQFVYFGQTEKTDLRASDEGELFWIDRKDWRSVPVSRIIACMMDYEEKHPDKWEVMVGTMSLDQDGRPAVQWSALNDPVVF